MLTSTPKVNKRLRSAPFVQSSYIAICGLTSALRVSRICEIPCGAPTAYLRRLSLRKNEERKWMNVIAEGATKHPRLRFPDLPSRCQEFTRQKLYSMPWNIPPLLRLSNFFSEEDTKRIMARDHRQILPFASVRLGAHATAVSTRTVTLFALLPSCVWHCPRDWRRQGAPFLGIHQTIEPTIKEATPQKRQEKSGRSLMQRLHTQFTRAINGVCFERKKDQVFMISAKRLVCRKVGTSSSKVVVRVPREQSILGAHEGHHFSPHWHREPQAVLQHHLQRKEEQVGRGVLGGGGRGALGSIIVCRTSTSLWSTTKDT